MQLGNSHLRFDSPDTLRRSQLVSARPGHEVNSTILRPRIEGGACDEHGPLFALRLNRRRHQCVAA